MSEHAHENTSATSTPDADDTNGTHDVDMTADEKRHDQLTRAPKSDESDAAPRIHRSQGSSGRVRIDVADTAKVRPGKADRAD